MCYRLRNFKGGRRSQKHLSELHVAYVLGNLEQEQRSVQKHLRSISRHQWGLSILCTKPTLIQSICAGKCPTSRSSATHCHYCACSCCSVSSVFVATSRHQPRCLHVQGP